MDVFIAFISCVNTTFYLHGLTILIAELFVYNLLSNHLLQYSLLKNQDDLFLLYICSLYMTILIIGTKRFYSSSVDGPADKCS